MSMKNLAIYFLLIVYFFINTFITTSFNLNYYNEIINPVMWISICGVAVFLSKDSSIRVKGEQDKFQSLLISLIIYIIVYFLLGLLFGFQRTPYSKTLFSILKNVWSFGGLIFFSRICKGSVIKN